VWRDPRAIVGASDTSGWAQFIMASSAASGFSGPLIPVHPRHQTVFGRLPAQAAPGTGAYSDSVVISVNF